MSSANRSQTFVVIAVRSVLVYRKPTHTDQYLHYTKEVARKVLFPPCLIQHIPLSQIKMTYTKKTVE